MSTIIDELQSDIKAIANDMSVYEEPNFHCRAEAIDALEFIVLDRIEGLLQNGHPPDTLLQYQHEAEQLKRRLEAIDERLFQRIRADIRRGTLHGAAFTRLLDTYISHDGGARRSHELLGYDTLDLFINGLLLTEPAPIESQAREPEMIYYQQTPVRTIMKLVDQAHLTTDDVFVDLGSGLGHVPILVNLLSGARTRGIEYEPAYCEYAAACARRLNLSGVEFLNQDARTADYSTGSVFFMYTPFTGRIMQDVLGLLRERARSRPITIFTYGPCTLQISQQSWLEHSGELGNPLTALGEFRNGAVSPIA